MPLNQSIPVVENKYQQIVGFRHLKTKAERRRAKGKKVQEKVIIIHLLGFALKIGFVFIQDGSLHYVRFLLFQSFYICF